MNTPEDVYAIEKQVLATRAQLAQLTTQRNSLNNLRGNELLKKLAKRCVEHGREVVVNPIDEKGSGSLIIEPKDIDETDFLPGAELHLQYRGADETFTFVARKLLSEEAEDLMDIIINLEN